MLRWEITFFGWSWSHILIKVSRRDQKRFRYLLFEVAMSLVAKLIRAFYAMLAKGVNYDPKKMMGDSERPAVYL